MALKFTKRNLFFLVLVFLAGIVLSLNFFFVVQDAELRFVYNEFKERSADRLGQFSARINSQLEIIRSLAGFFASSDNVTRDEFRIFVKNSEPFDSDIISFDWIPFVKSKDRLGFEKSVQQEGFADFRITEQNEKSEFVPAGEKKFYFPLLYTEPFDKTRIRFGFDTHSAPIRIEAIDKAIDTRLSIITPGFIPPGESSLDLLACRAYLAVYRKGLANQTVEDRRKNLEGFVSVLLRPGDSLEVSLARSKPKGIEIYIYDITHPKNKQLLYFYSSKLKIQPSWKVKLLPRQVFTWGSVFDVAGRKWLFVTKSTPVFLNMFIFWQSLLVLFFGVILTIILVFYLFELLSRTARIQALVDRRTLELKVSKERAELLYKVVPSAIFSVDLDKKITSWNDKAAEITGYSAQEVVGKNCSVFADLPCKDECSLYSKSSIKPIINMECSIRRKDGINRIISKNIEFLKDESGNIIGGIETFEDITERKQSEEVLRKLSSAIEQSPALTVITDKNGNIQYVNPKFTNITGYLPEEVIGKNPRILKSGDLSPEKYEDLWRIISKGDEWRGEFHDRKKDGSFYWEYASISSVKDDRGQINFFIKVAEDITERKRLEKLKDEFVSNVSHELRTPLSIIKEGVSLVLDGVVGEINHKQKAVLDTSKDNIDRLSRIINELLDISKIESGKLILHKEDIDIVELVKMTALLFENRIKEKGLELKIYFSDPRIIADIDRDRITQIFMNLIDNAIKFTDKGYIAVSVINKDKDIECSVEDTGRGISSEDLPKLFNKFEQFGRIPVGGSNKGTGLGLSIVKAIVVSHGGNISVISKEQQGSKFIFTLEKNV